MTTCYTDQAGQPCGKPAVASLAILPIGAAADAADMPASHIPLCMRHLLVLMYSNGVGAQELADVIDALSYHLARSIAADVIPKAPDRMRPPIGLATPVIVDEPARTEAER